MYRSRLILIKRNLKFYPIRRAKDEITQALYSLYNLDGGIYNDTDDNGRYYSFYRQNGGFSFEAFEKAFFYKEVFLRSLWIALISTAICLLIAYPLAYMLTKMKPSTQNFVNMLLMIPMWMNFLLRIYAWVTILQSYGPLDTILSFFGIHGTYLGNSGAVVLGMVYEYLPFMILPIYTVMSKIDKGLIEAAQDLGSNGFHVFSKVVLPLSIPGVISGITLVLFRRQVHSL